MRARAGIFVVALAFSAAVHVLFSGLKVTPAPAVSGGDVAEEVALGAGFADLVTGEGLDAVSPADAVQPVRADVSQMVRPKTLVDRSDQAALRSAPADVVAAKLPETAQAVPAISLPQRIGAAVVPTAVPKVAMMARTKQTLTAVPELPRHLARLDPNHRPPSRPEPTVERTEMKAEAARSSRGNSITSSARGQSSGKRDAKAAERNAAAKTQAAKAGAASIRTYHSKVLRRVARTRAPNAGARGVVLVSLRIASNGGLAGVGVAKSSGNARVDKAAVQTVQRAAPFEETPGGQQVRFTVRIDVRG